jgi:hypothetical protein
LEEFGGVGGVAVSDSLEALKTGFL